MKTNTFEENVKSSFDEVVNLAYRAGKNNDHPNNPDLHRAVDKAVATIKDLVLNDVIGEDEPLGSDDTLEAGKILNVPIKFQNNLRAEQRAIITNEGEGDE